MCHFFARTDLAIHSGLSGLSLQHRTSPVDSGVIMTNRWCLILTVNPGWDELACNNLQDGFNWRMEGIPARNVILYKLYCFKT